MTSSLSVNDVVDVDIVLSPVAAAERNFGSLLILGDSSVVDVLERLRLYTTIDGVAADFGSTAPEYLAALRYFSQSPQPQLCYVGRWARTASRGTLRGGVLSSAQQAMSNFTAIANGSLSVTIDGVSHPLSSLDLTAQTNLNGVASVIQTALAGSGTVIWDAANGRFQVKSATTGATSTVTFATTTGSGTDISSLLKLKSTDGGYVVAGIAAETLLAAAQALTNLSTAWYGLTVASSVAPVDADHVAVAAAIEAASASRIYGVTIQDSAALNAGSTTDLAYVLKAANLKRTFTQESSTDPYAAASVFGRAFTVDFDGSLTTLTLKFKQEPGITAESLTESQAAALKAKNCNVFVNYSNGTAILQEGVMCNGFFFDEVHGTDWLQNDLQTEVFNLLFESDTKIPQTDAGINNILARVSSRLEQAVTNGLVAPGVWTGPGIGAIKSGDTLAKGYYVYAAPVATQSTADRQARKAPVIQCAIKLAGAVHSANIIVNVNR
jgi:hypothetical protein